MIFTTPTTYAIRGLAELAARAGGGSMMLEQIATGAEVPKDFLAKLFQRLVKAGILKSTKGPKGGFVLARSPHAISLLQVLGAIEGESAIDGCVLGLPQCNAQVPCAQHDLYKPIRQRLTDYLQTTTLADLAASLKANTAWRVVRTSQEPTAQKPLAQSKEPA
jgi:Rrf2 family protein